MITIDKKLNVLNKYMLSNNLVKESKEIMVLASLDACTFEDVVDNFLESLKDRMTRGEAKSDSGDIATEEELNNMVAQIRSVWMDHRSSISNILDDMEIDDMFKAFEDMTTDYVEGVMNKFQEIKSIIAASPDNTNSYHNKFIYINNKDLPEALRSMLKEIETKIWFHRELENNVFEFAGALHRQGYKGNFIKMQLVLPMLAMRGTGLDIDETLMRRRISGLFRHEVEHLLDKEKGYETATYSEASIADAVSYYTSKSETNAYVIGLNKDSETGRGCAIGYGK
jgi:hypothetical protein